jgi:hypothetical protein
MNADYLAKLLATASAVTTVTATATVPSTFTAPTCQSANRVLQRSNTNLLSSHKHYIRHDHNILLGHHHRHNDTNKYPVIFLIDG